MTSHVAICAGCGELFIQRRRNATTCSGRCRTAAHRAGVVATGESVRAAALAREWPVAELLIASGEITETEAHEMLLRMLIAAGRIDAPMPPKPKSKSAEKRREVRRKIAEKLGLM